MTPNFSFLVTTDNHMGYKHDDSMRRKDSFMAFAETLQIARDRDVDFVLLGGDLFHMNRPNSTLEHKCIKILRQHMNAKTTRTSTTIRRVSGEFSHFERVKHGNFEDPSLSVPYPIFTIHGNHDDPTGPTGKSVCEKLATCGLLNYFGRIRQVGNDKEIRVEPIVLQKGPIKIALYGIGFIPDKKLCAAFKTNSVTFKQPQPDTFNVLIVHQNRLKYDEEKFIPDSVFPNWFHLIIRGHEHDAMKPELIPESQVGGLVYQPGSTVATSIEMRESSVKQCGFMSVVLNNASGDETNRYKLHYDIVDLRCYRKMIFRDIYQKEVFEHIKQSDKRRKLTHNEYREIFKKFVTKKIDELLEEHQDPRLSQSEASQVSSGKSSDVNVTSISTDSATEPAANSIYKKLYRFNQPMLRVRLEYVKDIEIFDALEVESLFYRNQVVNRDIIKFRKQKLVQNPDGTKENVTFAQNLEDDELSQGVDDFGSGTVEAIDVSEERRETVDTMIGNYFNEKSPEERLKIISPAEYTQAVRMSTEEGSVIAKVLLNKKNALLSKFESIVEDSKVAEENFGTEQKVHAWFIAAFQGSVQQPSKEAPLEDWDDNDLEVGDDEVMCLD